MSDFIKQQQELAEWISYRHTETPEDKIYLKKELDTLITQVITNTGEELLKRVCGVLDDKLNDYTEHICRFNDAPQTCECYGRALSDAKTAVKNLLDDNK